MLSRSLVSNKANIYSRFAAARNFAKIFNSSAEAVKDVQDGQTLLVGGFGLGGCPENLLRALHQKGVKDMNVVSNNCGVENFGLGWMLKDR